MSDLHLIPGGVGATDEPPAPPVQPCCNAEAVMDRLTARIAWVGVPRSIDGTEVEPGQVVAVFDADAMPELVAFLMGHAEQEGSDGADREA